MEKELKTIIDLEPNSILFQSIDVSFHMYTHTLKMSEDSIVKKKCKT